MPLEVNCAGVFLQAWMDGWNLFRPEARSLKGLGTLLQASFGGPRSGTVPLVRVGPFLSLKSRDSI
jgi:hypothetical protein